MYRNKSRAFRRVATMMLGPLAAWLSLLAVADRALAIPTFARKYRTSCITCHAGFPKLNSVGEAFRRNGYQFPRDDDLLVRDEPVPMGNEAYKDMWPNSIWPSDIPNLPPISLRARMGAKQLLNTPAPEGGELTGPSSTNFQFPLDYSLITAGTFGEDISWYAGMTLAGGGGGHGGEAAGSLEPELERLFVQFSNLFAWSSYDDDDGMREGNRWLSLPKHAMNLRVGQFDPGVIAPWASVHRQWGVAARLPNVVSLSEGEFEDGILNDNPFSLEPAQRGFELNGIIRQYNSYAIGLVNGNGAEGTGDNNTPKDFYFRVARKWFGYPLDGVLGDSEVSDDGGGAMDNTAMAPPMLDFWREIQLETGVFGYVGRNSVEVRRQNTIVTAGLDDFNFVETVGVLNDDFHRVGFDGRFQFQDLDIFGVAYWGRNDSPGADDNLVSVGDVDIFTYFIEADYFIKPWLTTYARYEELRFDSDDFRDSKGIQRGVVGTVFTVRTNMRVVTEFLIDAKGDDDEGEYTTNDAFTVLLDFAF